MRTLVRQETDRGSPSTPSVRPPYRARLRQLPPPLDPGETDPQRHQVGRAFGSLGPADRHALILCYFAELSDAQLALVLRSAGGCRRLPCGIGRSAGCAYRLQAMASRTTVDGVWSLRLSTSN